MPALAQAVFLSYASQDAEAARKICDALRASGLEVWFDLNELRGGDAWDQKIRRQIRECALFVPVISANSNARLEGYFRLEWKLAVDRSHLMADDHAFLVPVVIDDTPEAAARVPDRFREVQWTRLVLTETPAAFASRLQSLLAGGATARSAPADRRPAGGPSILWTRIAPAAGILLGLIFALQPIWRSRPARTEPKTAPAAAGEKPAAPPRSEARQLLARAQALYEPWDGATREDFASAEQLLKRATELDPTDGEVWAGYGLLTCGQIVLGHDRSAARLELARTVSERAVRLAPDSTPARFAQAFYHRFNPSTRPGVEQTLRALLEKAPADRLLLRTLAAVLREQRRTDESLALLDQAIALPGGDSVARYNKYLTLQSAQRFAAAEAVLDDGIRTDPRPYFLRAKATLLMLFHGDLDRAAELLAKIPAAHLFEDNGAYWASQVWLWRREPEKSLAVWSAVPRDLIETLSFNGPKAFVVGQAQQLAGRPAAAAAEWRAALRVVEAQHTAQPNVVQWVYWKARLLASLERKAEAEDALRTFEQLRGLKQLVDDTIPIYLLLGRTSEVLDALEKGHASVVAGDKPELKASWLNNLRFNPEWDALRGEPRFVALQQKP